MGIYDFRHTPHQPPPAPHDEKEGRPSVPYKPFGMPPTERKTKITYNDINVSTEEVEEVFVPGLRTMDEGIKAFFSNIIVPTRDSTKKVTARIAGGDKTILIWVQDLRAGRVSLPVLSINRASWEWNAEQFSPPWGRLAQRQFVDSDGSRMKLTPRPYPYLIEYQITWWTERKRDAEYILYDVQSRFNPLATIEVSDAHVKGPLTLKYNGVTDSSDIDTSAEEWAKVRYDLSISAEGWMPAPGEKIVPTVLGKVITINDQDGEVLDVIKDTRNQP